ncbi:hypothetical protein HNO88_001548 [Novosphingobium chloroacetimidivorans]|uniref:Uncharacterized protein n=1 Tax=Novosphingobium chloroacetimidivorans TaxID=1428314 RepID=A0A7W7NWA6_9SPHN|nr:hypothetical protein [Novosphingobium chloroacetimidivorans]MBB4858229.1 hypothetical protein [Novosphingobium chloroacetimidivorans]
MKTFLKTLGVTAALAATSLGFVQSAEARDRWGRGGGGDDAAIAIGAGIIGLAVGAAIADRGDGRYYDRRFYNNRRYVTVRGRPGYYYYYDNAPRRYYQDRFFGRQGYYGYGYGNGYYGNRWDRGYDRGRWDRRGYGRGWGGRGDWDRRGNWDRRGGWDRRGDWNGRGWGGRGDWRR